MARPQFLEVGAGCGSGVSYRADQDRARQHVFLSPDARRCAVGSAAGPADARNPCRTPNTSAAGTVAGDFHTSAARAWPPQAGREPAPRLARRWQPCGAFTMTTELRAEELELARYTRRGDTVVWAQGVAEPLTLSETLVAQRHAIGPITLFLGPGYSETLAPEHADC